VKVKQVLSFENLDANGKISNARESIRENINISALESHFYYQLKQIKP
jgi:hypothetical protein